MYRHSFSTASIHTVYATVLGPETDIDEPTLRPEILDPANTALLSSGRVVHDIAAPPYVWFVDPQTHQPSGELIAPYSMVYVEDAHRSYPFTGLTIFLNVVGIVRAENKTCARFQAWRATRDAFSSRDGHLRLLPNLIDVPLKHTTLRLPRIMSAFLPLRLMHCVVQDTCQLVRDSGTYRQPRLRNRITHTSGPVLLQTYEPSRTPLLADDGDIGLVRFVGSPTASIDIHPDVEPVDTHEPWTETRTASEDHTVSEDISGMLLGVGITSTTDWEMEPARAETVLGAFRAEETGSLSGTSSTICDDCRSDEDTLGSGISEQEMSLLTWDGQVLQLSDDGSLADDISDIVFETPAVHMVHTGPRYDVNGCLIGEDDDDMIIQSLLDD